MSSVWNDCPICHEVLFPIGRQILCRKARCYIVSLEEQEIGEWIVVNEIFNVRLAENQYPFYQIKRSLNKTIFYHFPRIHTKLVLLELNRVVDFENFCSYEQTKKFLNRYMAIS